MSKHPEKSGRQFLMGVAFVLVLIATGFAIDQLSGFLGWLALASAGLK